MTHLRLLCIFALVALTINVKGQTRETYGGKVELMELGDNLITFSSKGIAAKADDVLVAAEKNLFQKLLYDGVEGFHDEKPLVERNSPILDTFFHATYQKEFLGVKTSKQDAQKSLAYRIYVIKSALESAPSKNEEGKYQGTALITINHANLTRFLKENKVILDGDTVVTIKETPKVGRTNFLERMRNRQNK